MERSATSGEAFIVIWWMGIGLGWALLATFIWQLGLTVAPGTDPRGVIAAVVLWPVFATYRAGNELRNLGIRIDDAVLLLGAFGLLPGFIVGQIASLFFRRD